MQDHDYGLTEQETQALEMTFHWVRRGGREALKWAEYVLDECRVNPADIEQHIKQLLELMEQEYWHTQCPMLPCTDGPNWGMSVCWYEEIFKKMLKEIPKLIAMHRRFGLQNFTLEAQFSTTLNKILQLLSWMPSSTHNENLHKLLRNPLLMVNDLGGNEEYHDYLCDFMTWHTTFCAFTLDNANFITTGDSEMTVDLCKNLWQLAQNLGKIASTKAEQYQKLYEKFIAHREDLSHWLDSVSPGQGKLYIWFLCITFYILFILVGCSLVDSSMDSLKAIASHLHHEANFWNAQSNQFHKGLNIKQRYGCAIDAMPPFPLEQLNDHRSLITPSIHGSVTQVNYYPEFLIDVDAYHLISRMLSPSPNMCHKPCNKCQRLSLIYYKSWG